MGDRGETRDKLCRSHPISRPSTRSGGRYRIGVNSLKRAGVIETTVIKKHVALDVPTQAMKPWLRKPTTKSAEVQTVEVPQEVAVQTCRDAECQTDFEPPAEKSQQTSADIAIQTTEIYEQAVQTMHN